MKTTPMGFLKNNARHGRYHKQSDVKNVIKYGDRNSKKTKDDLIASGGVGVMEFLGSKNTASQFAAIQQLRTRKGDPGRYLDHEFFSFSQDGERLIRENNLDIDEIAREMAYDFYETDHCQVTYDVHCPPGEKGHLHIHFAVNTVNFVTGHKRRENMWQTRERELRFNKIVLDAISRAEESQKSV